VGGLRRMRERGRWLGAVAALAVLPSLAPDTFGLSCPHHGGGHAAHGANAPADASHSGSSGDHGHPTPAHPAAPAGGPGHGPASAPPAPPCTCAGTCPVSPTVTLAARPAPSPVPAAVVGSNRAAPTSGRIPVAPRHFLPLANGPPLG